MLDQCSQGGSGINKSGSSELNGLSIYPHTHIYVCGVSIETCMYVYASIHVICAELPGQHAQATPNSDNRPLNQKLRAGQALINNVYISANVIKHNILTQMSDRLM